MSAPILPGAEPLSHDGDERGVLVLHGFTGNPSSMRGIAEALVAEGCSVEMPLLPGHGTAVEDLMETGWTDWLAAAEAALASLSARCERVAVVGLSMGGGLTAWLAGDHHELAGIACLNAVVSEPDGAREMFEQMLADGTEIMPGIASDIAKEGVAESAYADTPVRPLLTLFAAVEGMAERLPRVTCPTLIVTSPQDHVVDPSNSDVLAAAVAGPVERLTAPDSYHVVTLDHDGPAVTEAVVAFCTKVLA